MSATALAPALEDSLAHALARWRSIVESELKGASFEQKLVTRTFDGFPLQPLYTRASLANVRDLHSKPGVSPYLRGVQPLGNKICRWEIAQTLTASTAAEFNAVLLAALMNGQNSVALSAHRAASDCCDSAAVHGGDGAANGVHLASADDLGIALSGVDLTAVPVHLTAGADPLPLAALYMEAVRRRKIRNQALAGSITADVFGDWLMQGELPAPLHVLCDSLAEWTRWAETSAPELRTIGVDATIWGNAGGTVPQELAFALATAVAYLRALDNRGVPPAKAARRFVFSFAIGPQFFTEIAKFRALRPLWTRVLTAFGLPPEAAAGASVSATTGTWNKTLLDPHVNMLRVTTEALSAVLGGCDRLHVSPFDEVSGVTTDFSRRVARNLHTLLAEEFNFAETADPAGGSWYVEKLTDDVARAAWSLFQDIESRGGMAEAVRAGYPQSLVGKTAQEKRAAVGKRRIGLVGTNIFPNLRETPLTAATAVSRRADWPSIEHSSPALEAPRVSVDEQGNRFVAALTAAQSGATLDQLTQLTRGATTVNEPIQRLVSRRVAEDFEALRLASTRIVERTGTRPRVFLAKMGPVRQHKARSDFSTAFFSVGGFDLVAKQTFETAEAAAAAAAESKAQVVVLCSTDETYPALVPSFAAAMRSSVPQATLVLAGLPADPTLATTYSKAGIDEFIHLRSNVHEVLAGLLNKLEASS